MLNPDAKAGKTARRRSGSLDSPPSAKSDCRKRGRKTKDKIKEIGERPVSPSVMGKNGSRGINRSSSPGNVSPTNNSIESLLPDPHFSENFGRPRTSSNASANSSIPGRLSPIHDRDELDDQIDYDEGMSPSCGGNMATSGTPNPATDELVNTLKERISLESPVMKQNRSPVSMISDGSPLNEMHSPATPMSGYDTGYDSSGFLTNHHPQQTHGIFSPMNARPTAFTNATQQQVSFQNQNGFPELQQQQQPVEAQQNLLHFTREQELEVQQQTVVYGNQGQNFNQNMSINHSPNTMNQSVSFNETYFPGINGGNPSIVINSNPAMHVQSSTLQQQTPLTTSGYSRITNPSFELTQGRYPFPSDLEGFGFEDLGLDCDVQSIIQSEMGDGGFDCLNLDQIIAAQSVNAPVSVGEMRLY